MSLSASYWVSKSRGATGEIENLQSGRKHRVHAELFRPVTFKRVVRLDSVDSLDSNESGSSNSSSNNLSSVLFPDRLKSVAS